MKSLKYIICLAALTMAASCTDEWRDEPLEQAKAAQPAELPDPAVGEPLTEIPFHKGVNINAWFDRAASQVDPNKIKGCDFDNLVKLGMDVVRLPINFHSNVGDAPDYKLDEGYLANLDAAVNSITSRGLWVILDHHSLSVETFPSDGEALITACCKQLALRYKGRDKVALELFNEPFGRYLSLHWPAMQGRIIKAVRACDPNLIIVATGYGSGPKELQDLPEYNDPRVIYTFHYYNPTLFTHQSAYWDENFVQLSGYPFPYDASRIPAITDQWQKESYLTFLYNSYKEAATVSRIREEITEVANWAAQHGKLVFCGEFGALNTSEPADRYSWYKAVGDIMNEKNIPWTIWQYNDQQLINFSIFKGAQIYEQLDLDMMKALGITIPAEFASGPLPLTLYSDTTEPWCNMRTDKNGGERYLDYYCKDNPAEGTDCIRYNVMNPTGGVWFEIWLPADISKLYDAGAKLEFKARTTSKFKLLEFYFQQYKEGAPRQWRIAATISSNGNSAANRQLEADGQWHTISIPLSEMKYHGCSGDGKERPDAGEDGFDWSSVHWLMITPNGDRMSSGKTIYFDDIRITK